MKACERALELRFNLCLRLIKLQSWPTGNNWYCTTRYTRPGGLCTLSNLPAKVREIQWRDDWTLGNGPRRSMGRTRQQPTFDNQSYPGRRTRR